MAQESKLIEGREWTPITGMWDNFTRSGKLKPSDERDLTYGEHALLIFYMSYQVASHLAVPLAVVYAASRAIEGLVQVLK